MKLLSKTYGKNGVPPLHAIPEEGAIPRTKTAKQIADAIVAGLPEPTMKAVMERLWLTPK